MWQHHPDAPHNESETDSFLLHLGWCSLRQPGLVGDRRLLHDSQRRLRDDLFPILGVGRVKFAGGFVRIHNSSSFANIHNVFAVDFRWLSHCAVQPPSTLRMLPVMNGFSSNAITACAASWTVPRRPTGCSPTNQSRWALFVCDSPTKRSTIGVSI